MKQAKTLLKLLMLPKADLDIIRKAKEGKAGEGIDKVNEDFFVEKESGDAYVEQVQETMPVICTLSHITKRETSMPYSRRTYLKSNGKPSSVSWPTTC